MPGETRAALASASNAEARWRPLLGAADRAIVLDIVRAIADELEARPRDYSFGRAHDLALADGDAGIALLHAELPGYRAAAERRIARAVDGVTAGVGLDASLHFGFTGIAWAWQHVMGREEHDDSLAAVDLAVLELLRHAGARLAPGLLFGLAGMAIYALDRGTALADACLAEIVDRLVATADPDPSGLRWWLPPPPGTAYVERFPRGFYDLGIDVGSAGIVAACARIAGRGIAAARAREVVAQAIRWMIGRQTARGIPSKLDAAGEAVHGFGWCKGELGMAIALLRAATETGDAGYLERAIILGGRAARVHPGDCTEPGFHIGAAGALHAFHRLYQATRLPMFHDAALAWLARLISLRRPGAGIAGFTSSDGETRQGLVQGAAGVGLALLATTTEHAPRWDRVLGA
jgi:lantibiotic biosynthesis protein